MSPSWRCTTHRTHKTFQLLVNTTNHLCVNVCINVLGLNLSPSWSQRLVGHCTLLALSPRCNARSAITFAPTHYFIYAHLLCMNVYFQYESTYSKSRPDAKTKPASDKSPTASSSSSAASPLETKYSTKTTATATSTYTASEPSYQRLYGEAKFQFQSIGYVLQPTLKY